MARAGPAFGLILCHGGFGVRPAGTPPRLPLRDVGCHCLSLLHWPAGRGRGLLGRPWTRMYHHQSTRLQDDPSIAVLDLAPSEHTVPMPAARRWSLVRPGCSRTRGTQVVAAPQAASSCRTAQVRGTHVPRSLCVRHTPRGRRLEAFLSATSPRPRQAQRQTPSATARGVSPHHCGSQRAPRGRQGMPPSPLTPRRRSTCVRSSRPSLLGP